MSNKCHFCDKRGNRNIVYSASNAKGEEKVFDKEKVQNMKNWDFLHTLYPPTFNNSLDYFDTNFADLISCF